jgi:hypothetical protein
LDVLGQRNTGAFYTKFQRAWLDCRFPGNTLSSASKITVEVLNENGTPQVITSSVNMDEGTIEFWVYGFHFSSPTIRALRATDSRTSPVSKVNYSDDWQKDISSKLPASSSPTASGKDTAAVGLPLSRREPNSRAIKITCIKGKQVKKFSGVNPKCPSGFRRK